MSGQRTFGLVLAMLLTLAIRAQASDALSEEGSCSPVDLRAKYPFLARVGNQGPGPGACFAYGAASLVSAKLGREVSANDLFHAFQTSQKGRFWRFFSSRGGKPDWAIEAAQKRGFCTEEALRSWNQEVRQETGYREVNLWDTLAALKKLGESLSSTPPEHRRCVAQERVREVENLGMIFPKIPLDEIVNILASVAPDEIVHRMIEVDCEKDRIEASFNVVSNWGLTSGFVEEAKKEIDSQLDAENPIAIGFRAIMLKTDKSEEGQLLSMLWDTVVEDGIFDAHVSAVIGRRLNKKSGKCEYLIRNSWGPDCSGYAPWLVKDSDQCEKGALWLPGDLLFPRTHMTLYLE